MIGPAKGTAVSAAIAHFGFAAAECFCYGDHLSDLSMLSVVGHPHVVDSDPALVAHAPACAAGRCDPQTRCLLGPSSWT